MEGGRAKQSARREAHHDAERLQRLGRPTRANEWRTGHSETRGTQSCSRLLSLGRFERRAHRETPERGDALVEVARPREDLKGRCPPLRPRVRDGGWGEG